MIAATSPFTRMTAPSPSISVIDPGPVDVLGHTTKARATGTAERFSTSTTTAGPDPAWMAKHRCSTSPPGTRMTVSSTGASARLR